MTVFIAEESFFVKADTFLCEKAVPHGAENRGDARWQKQSFSRSAAL